MRYCGEAEPGLGGAARHVGDHDETVARVGGFGGHGGLRQGVDHLGGEVQRIDQLALGGAGMDRDAFDMHLGAIGGEAFIFDLAQRAAIERIGEIGAEIGGQARIDAAADLFIGGEGEADPAMWQVRVFEHMPGGGHQDRHAGLVIGAQKRGARGGDDVMALFGGEIGRLGGRKG